MKVLAQLGRKIRLLCGLGVVTQTDDSKKLQQVQLTALKGEVRTVNRYQDYGFTSNPMDGAMLVHTSLGGNRTHMVVVRCDDGRYRKKDLAQGEVAVYHKDGSYVLLKNGGDIEVTSNTKVTVTAPEVKAVASTKITLDSPTVECTHDLHVTGNITNDGNVTSQGTITGNSVIGGGKTLETHTHPGDSGGMTGPPV